MNLLDALFESEDYNIRAIAASDKKAPIDRLMACINDTNQAVSFAALSNTILPIKVVIDYIKSNVWDESAIEAFCSRIDASTEEIWNLYSALPGSCNYHLAAYTKDSVVQCRIIMEDNSTVAKSAISTSEHLSDECALMILKSNHLKLIENVVKNTHVSVEVLEEAAKVANERQFTDDAVLAIISNPKCTAKALMHIVSKCQSSIVAAEAKAEFKKFMLGIRK